MLCFRAEARARCLGGGQHAMASGGCVQHTRQLAHAAPSLPPPGWYARPAHLTVVAVSCSACSSATVCTVRRVTLLARPARRPAARPAVSRAANHSMQLDWTARLVTTPRLLPALFWSAHHPASPPSRSCSRTPLPTVATGLVCCWAVLLLLVLPWLLTGSALPPLRWCWSLGGGWCRVMTGVTLRNMAPARMTSGLAPPAGVCPTEAGPVLHAGAWVGTPAIFGSRPPETVGVAPPSSSGLGHHPFKVTTILTTTETHKNKHRRTADMLIRRR
jgi:hypothetical protein